MSYPRITRNLDQAGIAVMLFRVLVHAARCAYRSGTACVLLSGMAATCGMPECRT